MPRTHLLITALVITAHTITALVITALVRNVVGRRFRFQPRPCATPVGRHRRKGARKPRIQPRGRQPRVLGAAYVAESRPVRRDRRCTRKAAVASSSH